MPIRFKQFQIYTIGQSMIFQKYIMCFIISKVNRFFIIFKIQTRF